MTSSDSNGIKALQKNMGVLQKDMGRVLEILSEVSSRQNSMKTRLESMEGRLDSIDGKLGSMDGRLGTLEKDHVEIKQKLYLVVEHSMENMHMNARQDKRLDRLEKHIGLPQLAI